MWMTNTLEKFTPEVLILVAQKAFVWQECFSAAMRSQTETKTAEKSELREKNWESWAPVVEHQNSGEGLGGSALEG